MSIRLNVVSQMTNIIYNTMLNTELCRFFSHSHFTQGSVNVYVMFYVEFNFHLYTSADLVENSCVFHKYQYAVHGYNHL